MKANYAAAERYVFELLERDLPPDLYFHYPPHTRDVLDVIERLVLSENLSGEESGEDVLLLRTGALYHDTGFLEEYHNNERIGVKIARASLPRFGYTPPQIEIISGIIMATQKPQNPNTKLEKLMCDADLDNLGREDFYIKTELLRLELAKRGMPKTPKEWYEGLITFLEQHKYFTQSAIKLRQPGKERHLQEIKELLGGQ